MRHETARPFGEVALDVLTDLALRMGRRRNYGTGEAIPATDDCMAGRPAFWRELDTAGFDARARGASVSLVRHGLLVAKGGRSELVRLEQVEGGVLLRALDRVAPYPWEIQ
jgi:hypothetical protein